MIEINNKKERERTWKKRVQYLIYVLVNIVGIYGKEKSKN